MTWLAEGLRGSRAAGDKRADRPEWVQGALVGDGRGDCEDQLT